VANAIIFLNISSKDDYLFWLGRAFVGLDLPPFWKCIHEDSVKGKYYLFPCDNTKINIHPSLKYVLTMMYILKDQRGW